jgi:protein-disulfide isomerase
MSAHHCWSLRSRAHAFLVTSLLVCLAASSSRAQTIPWRELKDASDLSAKDRDVAEKALRSVECYEGCKGSIASCLAVRPRVKTAWRLANYVVFLAGMTLTLDELTKAMKERKDSVLPAKVQKIALDDLPRLGDPKARVVLVEYADFQCGHCATLSPLLEKMVQHFKGSLVLYFKPYPLADKGPRLIAAQAALAAHRQGKFWPMAKLLFDELDAHTGSGVEALARKLKLDVDRFRAAMKDTSLLKQIERAKIEGVRLGLVGTPTLYFNGKRYQLPKDEKHLWDRVEEELDLLAAKR